MLLVAETPRRALLSCGGLLTALEGLVPLFSCTMSQGDEEEEGENICFVPFPFFFLFFCFFFLSFFGLFPSAPVLGG